MYYWRVECGVKEFVGRQTK